MKSWFYMNISIFLGGAVEPFDHAHSWIVYQTLVFEIFLDLCGFGDIMWIPSPPKPISFHMATLLKMAALPRPDHVTQPRDFNNFSSWRGQDATQQIWWRSDKNPGRSSLHSNACAPRFLGGAVELFWNFKSRNVFVSGYCMCVPNFIAVRETIRINSTRAQFSRWRYWVILPLMCVIPPKYKIFRQSWCVCKIWWVFEHAEGVKKGSPWA